MSERYSFVAITTRDLGRARDFWVSKLECSGTEELADQSFIVDAGGVRLCVDLPDGRAHRSGSTERVLGLKVTALEPVLNQLSTRGIRCEAGISSGSRGRFAVIHDPDGRAIILTETDEPTRPG